MPYQSPVELGSRWKKSPASIVKAIENGKLAAIKLSHRPVTTNI
jgi:hypothetical protein